MSARNQFVNEVIQSVLAEARGQINPNIRAMTSQWALTASEEEAVVKAVTKELQA